MHNGQHADCDLCYLERAKVRKLMLSVPVKLTMSFAEKLSEEQWDHLLTHRVEDEIREGVRPRFAQQQPPVFQVN